MKHTSHILFFTALLLLTNAFSLYGRDIPAEVLPDTAYFKAGQDDRNLLESVARNSAENTAMLLARGADPNVISSTGNSALMYAAEKGNMEIMRMLINAGADVNTSGFNDETPLFLAIFNNDFQSAKYLLEQGADPNVLDAFGVTPLIYAAATNQYQSADLLMFYEADETVRDEKGNDPLIVAVTFENIETTDVLLQNGLDPDVRDKQGNTPAIVAVQHGRLDILALLLEYDADVNIANNKRYTPLAYAVTYEDAAAVKLLLEHGADVHHHVEKQRNIMDLSRIRGNKMIVEMLADEGGKPSMGMDFSEFKLLVGNSFNNTDYFLQFRGGMTDIKYGWYWETGIDYRPFLLRVQNFEDDTLFQFRERRIGWSHTMGKYFRIAETGSGVRLSAYTALNGFLSFPDNQGTSRGDGINYNIIPSAGLALEGKIVGVRTGVDWYQFRNLLDKSMKYNVTFYFRISYPEVHFDRKEINWD